MIQHVPCQSLPLHLSQTLLVHLFDILLHLIQTSPLLLHLDLPSDASKCGNPYKRQFAYLYHICQVLVYFGLPNVIIVLFPMYAMNPIVCFLQLYYMSVYNFWTHEVHHVLQSSCR